LSPEAGKLGRRDSEPGFAEPWQAETMALAARLVEQGRFTATQWSAALGEEIRRAADAGEGDDAESYFGAGTQRPGAADDRKRLGRPARTDGDEAGLDRSLRVHAPRAAGQAARERVRRDRVRDVKPDRSLSSVIPALSPVIPAKAGIQGKRQTPEHVALDSRFHGNDGREFLRLAAFGAAIAARRLRNGGRRLVLRAGQTGAHVAGVARCGRAVRRR